MRIISRWYVALFMIVAVLSPLAAQEDLPPPLGFALNSEDHLRYYVYDFETEKITTIASTARPQGQGLTYNWGAPPPDELSLQSPYDPAVRFVLVNTMPGQDAGEGPTDWTLYRVQPDGTRQFITETIYTPFYSESVVYSTTEWSPDGRYYYVFSGLDFLKGYALYRLDLETNQMTLLLDKASGIDTCQPEGVWCIVYTYEERVNHNDDTPPKTLRLIDRNTGQLQELGTSATSYVSLYWVSGGSAFFYAMALDQKSYALHHYDLATHTDQLVSEWKGIRLSLDESPDKRWLMIRPTTRAGRGYNTGLYLLDMSDYTAEAFMLGENISAISQAYMLTRCAG